MSVDASTARVVSRYKSARADYSHKIVGRDARFLWGQWGGGSGWIAPIFKIEELPQKGKKKLRRWQVGLDLRYMQQALGTSTIYFYGEDLAQAARISSGDNYDAMVRKLEKAFEDEAKKLKQGEGIDPKQAKKWKEYIRYYPDVDNVFYLEVEPEGVEPFTVQGKDFVLDVAWKKFKTYSPSSDFQLSDPHYSGYEQSSPSSARKLYKILKADPEALRSVAWMGLSDWFRKQDIRTKSLQSVWR